MIQPETLECWPEMGWAESLRVGLCGRQVGWEPEEVQHWNCICLFSRLCGAGPPCPLKVVFGERVAPFSHTDACILPSSPSLKVLCDVMQPWVRMSCVTRLCLQSLTKHTVQLVHIRASSLPHHLLSAACLVSDNCYCYFSWRKCSGRG